MRKVIVALVVAALAVSVTVTGAVAKSTKSAGGSADICVLLPDPKSSVRWETQDRPGARGRVQEGQGLVHHQQRQR